MDAEKKIIQLINNNLKLEKIKIDDFLINYIETGSGPNLLLLHGINMGWGQWYPNIKTFSSHFKVYALDLPGAGGSTKIHPRKLDPEKHFVDVVNKFMQLKNIDKTFVVAHSLGGWIALKLVLREKSNINKLVLVSPLGFTKKTPGKHRLIGIYFLAKLLSRTFMRPTRGNIKKFIESAFHDIATLREEFIDYYYESIQKYSKLNHPFLLMNRIAGFLKVSKEFVLLDELSKINLPTLIIIGEKDSIIPFNAKQHEAFKLIPGARLEIFLNTGHVPATEKSKEFNDLVIKFLKSD